MSRKGRIKLTFTREVRLVLLLILLLVVALNFVTSLTFSKTKTALESKLHKDLAVAGDMVVEVIRHGGSAAEIREQLRRLRIITGMQEINFAGSPTNRAEIKQSWERLERGEEVLQKRGEVGDLIYLRPAYNQDGSFVGAILVRADVKAVATLNSLSFLDTSTRLGGTVLILLLGFVLLRIVMSPFRRMLQDSQRLDGGAAPEGKGDEVETIIETFSRAISELKEKEKTLQELFYSTEKRADGLARYNEYILGSISSGVVICSRAGVITRFNPAAETILGQEARAALERNFREVFGPDNPLTGILEEALEEEKTHSRMELQIRKGTGEAIQVGLTSSLIRDESGGVIGVFMLLIDISNIKALEREMVLKQQMAALGEMSAGLAHELRNGMAAVTGYSKLLERNLNRPSKLPEIVGSIIRESSAMERMLSHFLDFARQEELSPGPVELHRLVDESIVAVNDLIRRKGIDLGTSVSLGLPLFQGDGLLLRRALQNLLLNSCQAVRPGGKVRLRAYLLGEGRKVLKIVCLDDGPGIPEEVREKIFYPFFTTREKGTGLGLPFIKKAILLHGGTIEVKSKPGSFTAFIIRLPLKQVDLPETAPLLAVGGG